MRPLAATRLFLYVLLASCASYSAEALAEYPASLRAATAPRHEDVFPNGAVFSPKPVFVPVGGHLAPLYPSNMLAQHRIGAAAAVCAVAVDGAVSDCKITLALGGTEFAQALLQWLRQPELRFAPITLAGAPVPGRFVFRMAFDLADK
jgi:hypothetical protein